jgi:predicted nucleotidyltransferase
MTDDATGTQPVTHDALRARQRATLSNVLAVLQSSPHVLGVIAEGSYARGEHDGFSDLDLACFLRDEQRTGRPELYEAVGRVAPTLARLYLYDLHALYLFDDGVRLDLDFRPPEAIASGPSSTARILHDPDDVVSRERGRSPRPPRPPHPEHFEAGDPALIDWHFWMVRQAYCWTKRGAQGGYRSFTKLAGAAESIATAQKKLIEMRLWTIGVRDYLGRADPQLADRLTLTYARLTPDDLLLATRHLLTAFEGVAPDYCSKTGLDYDGERVTTMRTLLDEFDSIG